MIIGSNSDNNKNNSIKTNFTIKQNNTFIHEFDIYYIDTDGIEKAYDFTDCYLQFYIKSTYSSFIKRVGTVSVIDNTVRLYIADSELDFYGRYKYELVVTTITNETSTLVQGEMLIERSIINTLKEVVNEITFPFYSFFSILIIKLLSNKIALTIKSAYNIINSISNNCINKIESNYLITSIITNLRNISLNIYSNYSIINILVNKYLCKLNITSNYIINNIVTVIMNYKLSIKSNYSITSSQTRGATVSIVSNFTIEIL